MMTMWMLLINHHTGSGDDDVVILNCFHTERTMMTLEIDVVVAGLVQTLEGFPGLRFPWY